MTAVFSNARIVRAQARDATTENSTDDNQSHLHAPQGFFEIIFSGGPVGIGIMVCLISLSLLAVYLIIEQGITLRRKELVPEALADNVRQLILRGQLE